MSKIIGKSGDLILKPIGGWQWVGWDGKVSIQAANALESDGNAIALATDVILAITTAVAGKAFMSPGFPIPGVTAPAGAAVDEETLSTHTKIGGQAVVIDTTTGTFMVAGGPPPMQPTPAGSVPDPMTVKSGTWSIDSAGQSSLTELEGKSKPYNPDPSKSGWIEIELVDEEGHSVPGEAYRVTLPDGQTVTEGYLDDQGRARLVGFDVGDCNVSFPKRADHVWKRHA